jgi:hypothetical protein
MQDYLMTVAQKMGESMETLQVDLIASPGSPTFFKACNRTYFFMSEMVNELFTLI